MGWLLKRNQGHYRQGGKPWKDSGDSMSKKDTDIDAPEPSTCYVIESEEDKNKQQLDEVKDKDLINKWYEEARDMTPEKLPEFIRKLTQDYKHDYGTICHAVTAAAIGAAWSIDHSPEGGITGFQAGCIMWEFIRKWMDKQGPLRLVDFDDMLYPQYDHKFQKTIDSDTWEWLQEQAKVRMYDCEISNSSASKSVRDHWQSIMDGKVPFGYTVKDDDR